MSCEAFQIAHEMWAHGGEAELSRDDVAAHVAGCDACSSYVRRSSEATDMTAIPRAAPLDPATLRRRVDRKLFAMRVGAPVSLVLGLALGAAYASWQASVVPFVGTLAVFAVIFQRARRQRAALELASETSSDLARVLRAQLVEELDGSARSRRATLVLSPIAVWMLVAGHTALPMRIGVVALCAVGLAYEAVRHRRLKATLAAWRA